MRIARDIRICFIGDSFVAGTGDPEFLGWTGRVCKAATEKHHHSITHYNLGIRGNTSRQIEQRWFYEAAERFSDSADNRLVFSFGTNDNRVDEEEDGSAQPMVASNQSLLSTRRILVRAQEASYPVLLVGPPPVAAPDLNRRTEASSAEYGTLCQELGVPYLDVYHPLLQNEITWMHEVIAGDGFHPSTTGYSTLAQLVTEWPAWQHWFLEDAGA